MKHAIMIDDSVSSRSEIVSCLSWFLHFSEHKTSWRFVFFLFFWSKLSLST